MNWQSALTNWLSRTVRVASAAVTPSDKASARRVQEFWGQRARNWDSERGLHWTDLTKVQERINRKITGLEDCERYHYFVHHDLRGMVPVERALTLGCGRGDIERGMSQYDFCLRHDAVDISEGAIAVARALAHDAGLDHIRYKIGNLNDIGLPVDTYDVVLGISAIHHVTELEALFKSVHTTLKPGGYFYLDEFVGASQYQWPQQQVDAINEFLPRIPQRLRISQSDGHSIRDRVTRPTIGEMQASDPSEAIRSAEIIAVLKKHFSDITIRGYGGAILQMLLADIAANFVESDSEATEWLESLFKYEDELLTSGNIQHDFAVILARKPALI